VNTWNEFRKQRGSSMSKWQDKVKEIIYLLENSDVNEIDVTFWGRRFRVVKSPGIVSGTSGMAPSAPISPSAVSSEPITNDGQEMVSGDSIVSPMPGTFYRAASPDSDPFVQEGDQVVKGDTLCIIEAMKIMNEIESETNGVIRKILIENGNPVEYDQPLFIIDPNG